MYKKSLSIEGNETHNIRTFLRREICTYILGKILSSMEHYTEK